MELQVDHINNEKRLMAQISYPFIVPLQQKETPFWFNARCEVPRHQALRHFKMHVPFSLRYSYEHGDLSQIVSVWLCDPRSAFQTLPNSCSDPFHRDG